MKTTRDALWYLGLECISWFERFLLECGPLFLHSLSPSWWQICQIHLLIHTDIKPFSFPVAANIFGRNEITWLQRCCVDPISAAIEYGVFVQINFHPQNFICFYRLLKLRARHSKLQTYIFTNRHLDFSDRRYFKTFEVNFDF